MHTKQNTKTNLRLSRITFGITKRPYRLKRFFRQLLNGLTGLEYENSQVMYNFTY